MTTNIGSIDKLVRFIIAAVAVWAVLTQQVANPWDYVLYVVAAIMVLTALVGTCPIWLVAGIKTLKNKE